VTESTKRNGGAVCQVDSQNGDVANYGRRDGCDEEEDGGDEDEGHANGV